MSAERPAAEPGDEAAVADLRWYAERLCKDAPERYEVWQTRAGVETPLSASVRVVLARLADLRAAVRSAADEIADLRGRLAEALEDAKRARWAPMGDNHHNAAACPYCSPESEIVALRARLAEAERAIRHVRERHDAAVWRADGPGGSVCSCEDCDTLRAAAATEAPR